MIGTQEQPGGERLQKAIAAAGVASRRAAEEMIIAGRVAVNGEVVTELGSRIQEGDRVSVDGVPIQLDATRQYVVLNKPRGVVSTMHDEQGRTDLRKFTQHYSGRLYNVGRLDAETSGLLLLTNDGELAHVLAHPSFEVQKTYVAKVAGRVTPQTVQRLLDGVRLTDGDIAADRVRLTGSSADGRSSVVEVRLHSGRNRIVRRMLAEVGHPVIDLVRRQFGPLTLGSLGVGHTRVLTAAEVGRLLELADRKPNDAVGVEAPPARPGGRPRRTVA